MNVLGLLPQALMIGLTTETILLTCLLLLSLLLDVKTEPSFGEILILMSALPIGKGVRMRLPCNVVLLGMIRPTRHIMNTIRPTRPIATGTKVLGPAIVLILLRNTAVMGEMRDTKRKRKSAVATKGGVRILCSLTGPAGKGLGHPIGAQIVTERHGGMSRICGTNTGKAWNTKEIGRRQPE